LKATPIDALLVLMVVIWGANFSVQKAVFVALQPGGFHDRAGSIDIGAVIFERFDDRRHDIGKRGQMKDGIDPIKMRQDLRALRHIGLNKR
jgi:hypothetical protein